MCICARQCLFYRSAVILKMYDTKERMNGKMENTDRMEEYITFHITASDGRDVEMAVVDEFEFEHKNYLVSAVVENEEILDDDRFIYRVKLTRDDGFAVEKIPDMKEYERIAEAYMELE